MPPYTATDYLLDHTHITATLHKLYTFIDTAQFSRLASSEVFTHPTFSVDYTAMFGGDAPSATSPADIVIKSWQPMMEGMATTQHTMSAVVVEGLPVPGAVQDGEAEDVPEPKDASATAYVVARLAKRVGEKDGSPMGGLALTSNGGIAHYTLVKMGREDCTGRHADWDGNPWRVSSMKVTPKWYEGDRDVLGKVVPL